MFTVEDAERQTDRQNACLILKKTDSKKVWKEIRQLDNLKSRSGCTPTKLFAEDVEINDPRSMADVQF